MTSKKISGEEHKLKSIYLFSTTSHEDAISINSLDIHFLKPQIDFEKCDYLIITSKQACEALKQYEKSQYIEKKALCVSTQSALAYESLGGQVLAVGEGYGDNLVEKLHAYAKDTKWLYLRAKVVASDFASTCRDEGYEIDEALVYESVCSNDIKNFCLEEDSILIFTSPSSVKCFLQTHTIDEGQQVIVIGKTTAKALPKNSRYIVSQETTIQSCIKIAKNL